MASSQNDIGSLGEPRAFDTSDVFLLSREAFVRKAAIEAGKYWEEMHARNATASVGKEPAYRPKPRKNERFNFVCAAETIDIVGTSGKTQAS
ncbi:uncharacterized protein FTJAE_3049 [Fusarium tjaetaba]|uniref:Uncharacterized protein n=1 Tax=Fusarium tjaetaba TaxID=1567544 RepID=A0A8H5RYV3_9HYPO|nr:uncharacterized protein FTJAE_3049 [Fusarium tjaetaba]KAF5643750.1 hypothetical protein FTJAE_3049 [Fusarium tjaetaba]